MDWENIIQQASITVGFAEGSGLGAVLLAFVIIAVAYSPLMRTKLMTQLLKHVLKRK